MFILWNIYLICLVFKISTLLFSLYHITTFTKQISNSFVNPIPRGYVSWYMLSCLKCLFSMSLEALISMLLITSELITCIILSRHPDLTHVCPLVSSGWLVVLCNIPECSRWASSCSSFRTNDSNECYPSISNKERRRRKWRM